MPSCPHPQQSGPHRLSAPSLVLPDQKHQGQSYPNALSSSLPNLAHVRVPEPKDLGVRVAPGGSRAQDGGGQGVLWAGGDVVGPFAVPLARSCEVPAAGG